MSKYSAETKINVVKYVLEENHSIFEANRYFHIDRSVILSWVRAFREHGLEGLFAKHGTYAGEFKIHVVELMHERKISSRQAAALFMIPSFRTIDGWERIYYEQGASALCIDKRGRPGKSMSKLSKKPLPKTIEKDLIEEVQRLRMENEFLKKKIEIRERMMEEKRQKKSSSKP